MFCPDVTSQGGSLNNHIVQDNLNMLLLLAAKTSKFEDQQTTLRYSLLESWFNCAFFRRSQRCKPGPKPFRFAQAVENVRSKTTRVDNKTISWLASLNRIFGSHQHSTVSSQLRPYLELAVCAQLRMLKDLSKQKHFNTTSKRQKMSSRPT